MKVVVPNQGSVELIDTLPSTGDWTEIDGIIDATVANAARLSFASDWEDDPIRNRRLINYLIKNEHTSPLEHVQFQFLVEAPMVVWWQWVRHRTFAYQSVNSQSGRYVPFSEDDVYTPAIWRIQSATNKQGSHGEHWETDKFDELFHQHVQRSFELYEMALEAGICKEQARMFLPAFNLKYKWLVTVDLWNLLRFIKLRCNVDAQWEIRQYGRAMWAIVKKYAPFVAEAFVEYVLSPGDQYQLD